MDSAFSARAVRLLEGGDPVLLFDGRGLCTFANTAGRTALDPGFGTPVGRHAAADLAAVGEPALRDALIDVVADGRERHITLRHPLSGRWLRARVARDADGAAVHAHDTTDQISQEAAAAQSRHELLSTVAGGLRGSWVLDLARSEARLTADALRIYGLDPADGPVRPWPALRSLVHPDDLPVTARTIAEGVAAPGRVMDLTYRIRRADDGDLRLVHVMGIVTRDVAGAPTLVNVMSTDVTDLKADHDALRASEERLRWSLDNVDAIVCYQEEAGQPIIVSSPVERILGWTPDEMRTFEAWDRRVHPEDLPACKATWQTSQAWHIRYRMRHRDGSWVWLADRGRWMERGEGRPRGLVTVSVDVTHVVADEAALRTSEDRLRRTLEGVDAVIVFQDGPGEELILSPQAARILGYPRDRQWDYRAWQAIVHPDDLPGAMEAWNRSPGGTWDLEYRVRRADGTWIWLSDRGRKDRTADGTAHASISALVDVTARKSLEQQLDQARRIEALGQLAGGVAHDMNNILAAISGYGAFVAEALEPGSPAAADMAQVLLAAERAAALTRQLLAFGRRRAASTRVVDVGTVVDGLAPMLRRLLGEHIEVEVTRTTEPALVRCDPGQLEQVVMNLAVNARDAMPGGGRLAIRTSLVHVPDPDSGGRSGWVRLTVADTGDGMDEETVARVFEPFFTTKAQDRGTGLGLATVLAIVNAGGGRVEVASIPGAGTTFTVDLPVTAEEPAEPVAETPVATRGRGGRVLLAEDNASIRTMVGRLLETLGYEVVAAESGQDALARAASTITGFDVLVSDVRMPGMQGPELARRLRRLRPDLPVVFMTGFAGDLDDGQPMVERAVLVLKPFTAASLGGALAEVLGETDGV